MEKVQFFDSVEAARAHLDATDDTVASFADGIRSVDLNDNNATLAFLTPQLLRVEQAVYMAKYPEANYAQFVPVDTAGSIWSAGSVFYSGDIVGKAEWFNAASDDMPYADFSKTQFLQENHMAAIGYKWNRADLERSAQLGQDLLSQKAGSATKTAERFLHKVATTGDGVKFATGFFNDATHTSIAAGATIAASTPDAIVGIVNAALVKVEVDTRETFQADTLALPTAVYNDLATRRMTDTNMTVLAYILANSVVPNLTIKKTRHLTTSMKAYANSMEVHRFHLPGGGHQFGQVWQKGSYSWEVPGIMATGGYECRIPKAVVTSTGVAA
jgi:hypothetical protein